MSKSFCRQSSERLSAGTSITYTNASLSMAPGPNSPSLLFRTLVKYENREKLGRGRGEQSKRKEEEARTFKSWLHSCEEGM